MKSFHGLFPSRSLVQLSVTFLDNCFSFRNSNLDENRQRTGVTLDSGHRTQTKQGRGHQRPRARARPRSRHLEIVRHDVVDIGQEDVLAKAVGG